MLVVGSLAIGVATEDIVVDFGSGSDSGELFEVLTRTCLITQS